jgi:hypothetical protein
VGLSVSGAVAPSAPARSKSASRSLPLGSFDLTLQQLIRDAFLSMGLAQVRTVLNCRIAVLVIRHLGPDTEHKAICRALDHRTNRRGNLTIRIIGTGDALTNKLITLSGVVTLAHSYEIPPNRIGFAPSF